MPLVDGGWWSAPRLGRFTPRKDQVPVVQEAGWAPGPVWTGTESLASTGIRSPGRPARWESLYLLSYRGPFTEFRHCLFFPPSLEINPFYEGWWLKILYNLYCCHKSFNALSCQLSFNLVLRNTWLKFTLGHPMGQSVNQIWIFRYSGTLSNQRVWNYRFWRWEQHCRPETPVATYHQTRRNIPEYF
jgi:hypothetical protein